MIPKLDYSSQRRHFLLQAIGDDIRWTLFDNIARYDQSAVPSLQSLQHPGTLRSSGGPPQVGGTAL
jgi:hypothetical protein